MTEFRFNPERKESSDSLCGTNHWPCRARNMQIPVEICLVRGRFCTTYTILTAKRINTGKLYVNLQRNSPERLDSGLGRDYGITDERNKETKYTKSTLYEEKYHKYNCTGIAVGGAGNLHGPAPAAEDGAQCGGRESYGRSLRDLIGRAGQPHHLAQAGRGTRGHDVQRVPPRGWCHRLHEDELHTAEGDQL